MANGKKRKSANEKPAVYVSLDEFVPLLNTIERIWGADSMAYQVVSLQYSLSSTNRLPDERIKQAYNETLGLAKSSSLHKDFWPNYELMVGRELRHRRELRKTYANIEKAVSNSQHFSALAADDPQPRKTRQKSEKTLKAFCLHVMGKRYPDIYEMSIKNYKERQRSKVCKDETRRIRQNIKSCKDEFIKTASELLEQGYFTLIGIVHYLWDRYVPETWQPHTSEGKSIEQGLIRLIQVKILSTPPQEDRVENIP